MTAAPDACLNDAIANVAIFVMPASLWRVALARMLPCAASGPFHCILAFSVLSGGSVGPPVEISGRTGWSMAKIMVASSSTRSRDNRNRLLGWAAVEVLSIALPLSGAQASSLCQKDTRTTSIGPAPSQWAYSGVSKRTSVRLQRDCPCQVIVRSFRRGRTNDYPCLGGRRAIAGRGS